ncbi:unnamed protein product [Gadus morhua 'NCC']
MHSRPVMEVGKSVRAEGPTEWREPHVSPLPAGASWLPRAPASSTEGPTVQTEGNIEPSSDETQRYRRLLFTAARPLCKQGPGLRGWSSKEGRLTAQTKAMLAVFDHNTNNRLNLMKISFSRSVPV